MSTHLVISICSLATKLLIVAAIVSSSMASPLLAEDFDKVVLAALEREKGLQLTDVPLEELAQILEYRLDVNTVVDHKAFEMDAVPVDTTMVSVDLPDGTLKSALTVALQRHELRYTTWNGTLHLTTRSGADEKRFARAHPIAKRLRTGGLDGEVNGVLHLIEEILSPDEWEMNGGNSNVNPHNNHLVVSAPLQLQDDVDQLLKNLEQAEKKGIDGGAVRRHEKIRQKLAEPVNFNVVDLTLEDLAVHCRDLAGVPFVVNERALEDDAIPLDTEVSGTFHNLPLGHALRMSLERVDLAWIACDEVVYITTRTRAAEKQITSCFPVDDLTAGSSIHMDQLIILIEEAVAADEWEVNGGNGAMCGSPSNRVLVMSSTELVTEQVERFLAHLRRNWDAEAFARRNKRPETQFYLVNVPGISAGQVVTFLKSESSGIRWDKQSSCTVLGDRIAVRNRRHEQMKIDRMLWQLSSTGQWQTGAGY